MRHYILTAEYGTHAKRRHRFTAPDDGHASMYAITFILNRAVSDHVWAKGAITLTGPEGVVRTMEAKEVPA